MRYAAGKVTQGRIWRDVMAGLGTRWVEPFCGGLGAFQAIAPYYPRALLSDLSPVALMWQEAKNGWIPDVSNLSREQRDINKKIAFSSVPTSQSVYITHTGGVKGAADGGWASTGHERMGLSRFRKVVEALQSCDTEIRQCDYRETLAGCGRGDVVYLDPPYDYAINGRGNTHAWVAPTKNVNPDEMIALAELTVDRGAIVFVSHYGQLDPARWAVVYTHRDDSFLPTKGEVRISNEYLYVNIDAYKRFEWKEKIVPGKNGPRRVRVNRTAVQATTRTTLIGDLGYLCEATGRRFPNGRRLELAHDPKHTWAATGTTTLENAYLVSRNFHAEFEVGGGVSIEEGRWVITLELREDPDFKGAHGRRAKFYRDQPLLSLVA